MVDTAVVTGDAEAAAGVVEAGAAAAVEAWEAAAAAFMPSVGLNAIVV